MIRHCEAHTPPRNFLLAKYVCIALAIYSMDIWHRNWELPTPEYSFQWSFYRKLEHNFQCLFCRARKTGRKHTVAGAAENIKDLSHETK